MTGLLDNAKTIYKTIVPARMGGDAADFTKLQSLQLDLKLDSHPDIVEFRNQTRVIADEQEENRLLDPKAELEASALAAYSYSDDLPEGSKLHLVSQ